MAPSTTQIEEHVSLKLLLNERGNKVLFAEADKDFVDILCSFLTMPLGTVARLIEKESGVGPVTLGCLNSLYHSVANLDDGCFSADGIKQVLLEPINAAEDYCNTLKINIDDTPPTKYLACNRLNCRFNDLTISPFKDQHKCRCGYSCTSPVFLKNSCQGFVVGSVTFFITDNLTVIPNGLDYTRLRLLQEHGIKYPSLVKEIVLKVTKEKVLDLLKHSLFSTSTLTDLFLAKKPSLESSRFFFPDGEITQNLKINMKLVIRKSDGKILFAHGEHQFADMILTFLTIPLGLFARLFGGICSLGSINRLYKSISDFNENKYFMSKEAKNRLVDTGVVDLSFCAQFFKHYGDHNIYTGNIKKMYFLQKFFVKGPVMYVVTDDLVVSPLTPISALDLLNRFETPITDLKEKDVIVGVKEVVSIMMAALTSTAALTNGLAHLLTEV
ncbi:uncharacterized protein LOC131641486 [Vicia villosa]|uniref:uncharacterized protein LOC131641486 n=1 Tax=Vicia villosa TaxID=3911 RepID=UPI00273C9EFD|nr:uncharacterized protein LOC131641486 [Vicia villosa]